MSLGYGADEEDCKVLQLNKENGVIKEYNICEDEYISAMYTK
nr:hypothetical protein [uncultured Eubacterium sp.]